MRSAVVNVLKHEKQHFLIVLLIITVAAQIIF